MIYKRVLYRSLTAWTWLRTSLLLLLTFGATTLVFPAHLLAQFDSAGVNGTVRDQSGAAIPHATIQLENRDTGLIRSTVTNSTGTYNLSEIPPGVYTVTATATGFATSSRAGVTLNLSETPTFDFALKPGSQTEQVVVSSSQIELQTSSTAVGAVLDTQAVNSLPLNGRNYTQLLLLQPGVNFINGDQTGGRTNSVGSAVYPSVQGQNNRSNTYLLDGVNNNEAISGAQTITPIPDDIQELRVLTHNDYAQFGGAVGGIINVVTKSGTNQFHGSAWEFWRGSSFLDAKTDPTGVLQSLHQNQFGGAIGGPVVLPLYNGKNRTFFYGSYEGFRQTIGQSSLQLVPTPAQLSGNFGGLLAAGTQLYNPFSTTRSAFTGNQIPAQLIDPNMVKLAQTLFPAPTGLYESGVYNYLNTTPETHNSDQYDLRGDEYLNQKNQIWAHFLHQNNPVSTYAGIPGITYTSGYVAHNFGAQWIHTFGPSALLTVGFGQNIGEDTPSTVYAGNVAATIASANFASSFVCGLKYGVRSSGCMLPEISLGSYMSGGENNGSPNYTSDVWEYKADYQQSFGRHTVFVGLNIDTNNQGVAVSSGTNLGFSPFQTSNGSTGGNELASFLLGLPNSASRSDIENTEHSGYVDGFYVQDQWKVRDNLTVNLGVRYDISLIPVINNKEFGAYYDIFDFSKGVDVVQNLPPACSGTQFAPCLPGGALPAHVVLSTQPGKLFFPDYNNIQPRFGMSWAFRPDTVLHAGFGRVYDNWSAVDQSAQNVDGWLMQTTASVTNLNTTPGVPSPTTAENPLANFAGSYPTATPFDSIGWNTAPQFHNPYSDQWTIGIQQKASRAGVWTLNYVGSRGRKLDWAAPANTATTPGPGPVAARTPFPYMQQSYFDRPLGQLDYNAMETSFQGRSEAAGISYLVSYTWSKGLDYGTDGWYGVGNGTTSIENPYNFKNDRGPTGYDIPQLFTAGWTWSVPLGKGNLSTGSRIGDYLAGNWQLNGIATLESGRPYTVQDAGDIANTGNFTPSGSGYERPNQIGNPKPAAQTPSQWINPAAFTAPAQYTYGDTPRNSLRTDPYKNLDLSVFREFPLFETTKLQLRMDGFNTFNHPVWGIPNYCQNCANFGVITSTVNSSREFQLSGKIVF